MKQDKDIALRVTKQFYNSMYTAQQGANKGRLKMWTDNSIVAGGAIRDTIFGKEIQDIDIFIPKGTHISNWQCREGATGNILGSMGFKNLNDYGEDTQSFRVVENRTDYDLPVQLIFSKHSTPADIIKAFPVSISRVYWSPKDNKIHKSGAFREAEKTGCILYSKKEWDSSHTYTNKIYDKYNSKGTDSWTWRKIL